MKKFALISVAFLALAGCNGSAPVAAVNSLATLAKNDIPAACAIIKVAEGYFAVAKPFVPASAVTAEATAEAAVAAICNNPPTDVASAFAVLLNEWTLIQSSTKTTAP